MTGKYVSVAIDHGTTNSCIAHMTPDGARVVKIKGADIMPSAVYQDKKGRQRVGQDARQAMMTSKATDGEGYTGYKLQIGQAREYQFTAAGKTLTAPELGSLVMRELLAAYQEEQSERLRACVITIPAKFEQSACEGTRRAAALAGLEYAPFIMEPVAAATAFGYKRQADNERWIVFDIGGGTLDVSLLIARGGTLMVPEEGHAGDDQLGGRKFDRELFEHVMGELRKTYQLDDFSENNPTYRVAWGKLLLAVEQSKIDLSIRDEARVEVDDLCLDGRGNLVQVDVRVTRARYQELIAPGLEKAVGICQNLIAANRLRADQIERVILIGGPTKTPYLRTFLADRLKIPLDFSFDPMTAVALGAATYADTQEKPPEMVAVSQPSAGPAPKVGVKLQYERQSALSVYTIAGQVEGARDGVTVEIRRSDGGWTSGKLQPDADGFFTTELVLIDIGRPQLSQFTTALFSATGEPLTSVAEPEIWYPYPAVQNRLSSSIRVAVQFNHTLTLLRKGQEVSKDAHATGDKTLVTTKALKKGSPDDVIRIPILESVANLAGTEDEHADCNIHVGTLTIVGNDAKVTSDVPLGSEVKLTISIDESRRIKASAYVPFLDQEFEAVFEGEPYGITVERVEKHFADVKNLVIWKERIHKKKPLDAIAKILADMKTQAIVEDIERNLARAKKNEADPLRRAYKLVLELAGTVNAIIVRQRPARIEYIHETLRPVVPAGYRQILDDLDAKYRSAAGNATALEEVEDALENLESTVRGNVWEAALLDLKVLSGRKGVNQRQAELFRQTDKLTDEIVDAGGYRDATEAQLRELQRLHDEMLGAYPDLAELRSKAIQERVQEQKDRQPGADVGMR